MRLIVLVSLCCAAVSASSSVSYNFARIIGGTPTTIDNYPSLVGFLRAADGLNFRHNCGGSILNERNILTAAHCDMGDDLSRYRIRVGSTFGDSGGSVYNVLRIINHPNYRPPGIDSDIAVLHVASHITLNDLAQQAAIAGPNFIVPDNEEVWAAGWGVMENSVKPEQLRHVSLVSVNQEQCRRFIPILTDNMICASPPRQDSAGQCSGDSGGPLYYRNIVVGVCSFTIPPCGRPDGASVNVRVSRFTSWILENSLS